MGEKERAQMLLELDKAGKELKELAYKISQYGAAYEKAAYFLKHDPAKADLNSLPLLEEVKPNLDRWRELTQQKEQLEKALGTKFSNE